MTIFVRSPSSARQFIEWVWDGLGFLKMGTARQLEVRNSVSQRWNQLLILQLCIICITSVSKVKLPPVERAAGIQET